MHPPTSRQIAVCSLLWLLSVAGCQRSANEASEGGVPAGPAGAVAVIDLDDVARQLGRDTQMAAAIAKREEALNQQLQSVQAAYRDQLSAKQLEFGSGATPDQTQQLAQMQREAYANLSRARDEAEDDLREFRLQLISGFRDQVKPVARFVATQKGLSVVVTKNDNFVFSYEACADITASVAAQMLTQNATDGPGTTAEQARSPSEQPTRR